MGVFMNKLLGLTIIFSIMSFFGLSAMETYEGERAVSQEIIDKMRQDAHREKLRKVEETQRQQRAEALRRYQQELRQERENRQENRPAQRRLFFDDTPDVD